MKTFKSYLTENPNLQKALFISCALLSLTPFVSAPIALCLGLFVAQISGNVYAETAKKAVTILLQVSVVGLGFGMNATDALKAGKEGFVFAAISIVAVLLFGFILTKLFKIDKITGYLISAGTAICGGSAIAAISPIVKAKPNQLSVALAVIFILNSAALLIFPPVGKWLQMSQHEFGLWCAIAIHDTSSVVGAASKYGAEALEVATIVKLARALWIIPLSIFSVALFKNKATKIKIPWFIGLFVIAMLVNSYVPGLENIGKVIVNISKAELTLALFLIGSGLSFKVIGSVGAKPLILAVILWMLISFGSLFTILN